METARIKVKLGADEFEAEGPKELVTAQFESFMAAVAAKPIAPPPSLNADASHGTPLTLLSDAQPPLGAVSQSTLDRVYRQGDTLSLAALPNGENAPADAMLAILYGYMKLKNETTVTGTALKKSAKLSGVPVERLDRLMAANQPDYVLSAGIRKARRYQLNNRGIARAEEIIRAILQ